MGIGGDSAGASDDADILPDTDVAYNLKNGASHLVSSTCDLGVGGMAAGESLACGAEVSPTKRIRPPFMGSGGGGYKQKQAATTNANSISSERRNRHHAPPRSQKQRAHEWSMAAEDQYRLKASGWADIHEYRAEYGEPKRYPPAVYERESASAPAALGQPLQRPVLASQARIECAGSEPKATGFIKSLRVRGSGFFVYHSNDRECADKYVNQMWIDA